MREYLPSEICDPNLTKIKYIARWCGKKIFIRNSVEM